jgi:nitrate reductase delta subunit
MTDRRTRVQEGAPPSRGLGDARRDFGFRRAPSHVEALDRVRAWTRERFKLAETSPVMAAEVACGLPGCPPLETVVAFWTEDDRRHQFKLFKPVAEVVYDDLPFAWLRDSLVFMGEDECC